MGRVLRWPLLPILVLGLVNVLVCYGWAFWGANEHLAVCGLVGLALLVGWCTREKTWGSVAVMLMPWMFLGSAHHGRPWQWLVISVRYPPVLLYVAMELGPVIVGYVALIALGRWARVRALNGDRRTFVAGGAYKQR